MIDIEQYIETLIHKLTGHFDARLIYVGLQGSYLRADASEDSDIDIMVVIDGLTVADLTRYRAIIHSMDYSDKSCGFICSKADISKWNTLEVCHLLHTTKDYFGNLRDLVPAYTAYDIRTFIQLSLNNLYHEICHRHVHSKVSGDITTLKYSFKNVFFILQNLYFYKTGTFITTKIELLSLLDGLDFAVLQRSVELNRSLPHSYSDSLELLFTWCQRTLVELT